MGLAARIGTMARRGAPFPYDAEVEYLESTGTQYFDTGVTPKKENIQSWGLFQTNIEIPFGCLNFAIANGYHRFFTTSGLGFGQNQGKFHTWKLNSSNKELLLDGEKIPTNVGTVDAVGNLWLFGRSDTGAKGKVRLYFFKEEDQNGNPVFDFIFVRVGPRENCVGCMYDRVSGKLFRNLGTGEFIIGPDKTT